MQYNKEKWVAALQKTVMDLNTATPTSGKVCAIASLRTLRDTLIDDLFGDESKSSEDEKEQAKAIRESFSEMIKQVSKDGADSGFLSNASAAAKAAGFKNVTAAETEIAE